MMQENTNATASNTLLAGSIQDKSTDWNQPAVAPVASPTIDFQSEIFTKLIS
jgi:hypothetical protein